MLPKMKNKLFPVIFICLFFTVNLFSQQNFTAKVVGVVDGDTITVYTKDKRQLMFHLNNTDAPEKDQDFGETARQFLSNMLLDQTVLISNTNVDCMERYSATVSFNKKDVGLALVESGNAWADSRCRTDENLVKAEIAAREKKTGLWQNPNAVRPSDFLKSKQQPAQTQITQSDSRKIFTGLAPTPPPKLTPAGKPSGIYIGMTLEDFTDICGDKGEKGRVTTGSYSRSFSLDLPDTKENIAKGCNGGFGFSADSSSKIFKLTVYTQ